MVVLISLSVGLLTVFLLGVPVAWLTFMVSRGMAHLERSRAGSYGAPIADSVPPLVGDSWARRLGERFRSTARWREVAHHVVAFPVCVVSFTIVSTAWSASLAMALLPFVIGTLPDDTAHFHLFEIAASDPMRWSTLLVGAIGLLVIAPRVTQWSADLQWHLADRLLGATEEARLAAQVVEAQSRRSAAVDAAEAERRRIERDLHDGAQQRLVALAATLGAARDKFDDDPDAGKDMVAAAHEEAKAALVEIRDLVRGIHPVILEDRGIDAALSAVVARSPVPVVLDVQVGERPPAAVESAAYFIVTEALTNVARHSGATRATVSIARTADRLVVEISDNGHGGADASRGTGLRGLRERVTGMGGTTYVMSPEGGPTTILAELPCGS
jgi:signal transduction histidine kinase